MKYEAAICSKKVTSFQGMNHPWFKHAILSSFAMIVCNGHLTVTWPMRQKVKSSGKVENLERVSSLINNDKMMSKMTLLFLPLNVFFWVIVVRAWGTILGMIEWTNGKGIFYWDCRTTKPAAPLTFSRIPVLWGNHDDNLVIVSVTFTLPLITVTGPKSWLVSVSIKSRTNPYQTQVFKETQSKGRSFGQGKWGRFSRWGKLWVTFWRTSRSPPGRKCREGHPDGRAAYEMAQRPEGAWTF